MVGEGLALSVAGLALGPIGGMNASWVNGTGVIGSQALRPAGPGHLRQSEVHHQGRPMPGVTFVATLATGHDLAVSRIQSRVLRETLLRL